MSDPISNPLPLAFQIRFSQPIWRLVFEQIDTAPGLLVAELRSRDTQTLKLATVSLPDGTIRSEVQPALPFHSSLVGVWNGQALYHRFDNNRLPAPTALGNVNLQTGRSQWEWSQHVLVGASSEWVWARRASLTDTGSTPGIALRLTDGEPAESAEKPAFGHNSRLLFPVSYTTTSTWWPVLDRFIKKVVHQQALDSIDYLEVGDKLIFSYYYRETNEQLRSSLLIIDRQQTIWLHQHTGQELETTRLAPESTASSLFGDGAFCVWGNQIIIQPASHSLTSYFLTSTP
ncbi:hypothetical protein ACFQ4C_05115 [Larkinella insperata]|uniref:DUF4905 domain-containing protein n=1 Tax=Larkinella insperata TaxID=332158 RepID=A0ABW3QEQ3_9BACT|nr:hypothetical protein [Larkinella insperata]